MSTRPAASTYLTDHGHAVYGPRNPSATTNYATMPRRPPQQQHLAHTHHHAHHAHAQSSSFRTMQAHGGNGRFHHEEEMRRQAYIQSLGKSMLLIFPLQAEGQ